MTHFDKIKNLITEANQNGILKENDYLTGFSGKKYLGALQRLAKLQVNENQTYVEIGVFQGLTLLSVASVVDQPIYGIDNFAFFDPEDKNFSLVRERRDKLGFAHAQVINMDYEDALSNLSSKIGDKKVGLYFVDGPHDYRSQLICLLFGMKHLSDNAIIVIDDCNYAHVRQANRDFLIAHPDYKLIFEAYTNSHPDNMSAADKKAAKDTWWNGLNIIVRDPNNELKSMYPPTIRSRQYYENEHTIHSMRFPEAARWGTELAEKYWNNNFWKALRVNWRFFKKYTTQQQQNIPTYEKMNTYSQALPSFHLNE